MHLCLTTYAGHGTRRDPFRPFGADGDWSAIDLRPDCSVSDGYALLATETCPNGAVKVGDGFLDTFSSRIRNRVHNRLGVDVSRVRRFDVLAATLLLRPNGWNPLRPTKTRYEIWLGSLVWEFPLIQGGASDNFNRANESSILAPWSSLTGLSGDVIGLKSNAVASGSGGDAAALYASAASSNDQYSQVTWLAIGTDTGGPAVRVAQTGNVYALDNSGSGTVIKFVGGAFTDLTSPGGTKANPGKIDVSGTTINTYYNGVANPTPKTDVSIATGQPGVFAYNSNGAQGLDDWSGGDLVAPGAQNQLAWVVA